MKTRSTSSNGSANGASTPHDGLGALLLGLAIAASPLDIWSVAVVAGHGVTVLHLVAILFTVVAVIRIGRMPLTAAFALYCLLAVIAWGIVVAFLQSGGVPSLARSVRNAVLYLLMFGAFAGASTVRLDTIRRGAGLWIATRMYAVLVIYAVYQAVARRMDWPFGFLRVTNPTFRTDPFREGLQHGITAAKSEWGEYFVRASATFAEPSYYGRYLAYGFAVSLAMIPLGGKYARWASIGLAFSLAGLAVNYSLNGILVYAVIAAVMALPLLSRVQFGVVFRVSVIGLVILAMAMIAAPAARISVLRRFQELSLTSSSGRFEALPRVVEVVQDKPWGAGLAGVEFANDIHNGLMLFVVQFGFVGVIVPLLWVAAVVAALLVVLFRRRMSPFQRAAVTASAAFIAAQVAAWVGGAEMHNALVWILSGAAFGAIGRALEPSPVVRREESANAISPVLTAEKAPAV